MTATPALGASTAVEEAPWKLVAVVVSSRCVTSANRASLRIFANEAKVEKVEKPPTVPSPLLLEVVPSCSSCCWLRRTRLLGPGSVSRRKSGSKVEQRGDQRSGSGGKEATCRPASAAETHPSFKSGGSQPEDAWCRIDSTREEAGRDVDCTEIGPTILSHRIMSPMPSASVG